MGDTRNPQNQYKNGTYIFVLCLFFFLLAIITAYLLRRYGCLTNATNTSNDDNLPTNTGRGMDAQEIESLPSLRFSEIKAHWANNTDNQYIDCAVCLNEFKDQETLRILPDCLHVFHPNCIEPWLSNHATCPVCRASLEHKKGSNMHLSEVIQRVYGNLSERFDDNMVGQDYAHEHLNVDIEGNSRVNVDSSRGRLRRSYSTGELEVRFVGGSSRAANNLTTLSIDIENFGVKSDYKSMTP